MQEFYSEGCVLLRQWLGTSHEQQQFALRAGVDPAFFNHIIAGRKRPSLDTAAEFEALTEGAVPASCWHQSHATKACRGCKETKHIFKFSGQMHKIGDRQVDGSKFCKVCVTCKKHEHRLKAKAARKKAERKAS